MPETTGIPSSRAAAAMPSIARGELPGDLGTLRVAEVQAVGERERLAARAGDVERGAHHRAPAGPEGVALAGRRAVERDGEAAPPVEARARRRRDRAGAPCGSRRAGRTARRPRRATRRRPGAAARRRRRVRRFLLELVARGLARSAGAPGWRRPPRRRDGRASSPSPSPRRSPCREAPSARRPRAPRRARRVDDGDHPLLRLGDHDLPGLQVGLAQRHAVELDLDPGAVRGHLGERRGEPRRAAVLKPRDELALARARARPRSAPCRGTGRRSGPTAACRPSPRDPGLRAPRRRRSRRAR